MGVARNVVKDPRLLPGGGAVEMAISRALSEQAASVEGIEQWPYRAVGEAVEVRRLFVKQQSEEPAMECSAGALRHGATGRWSRVRVPVHAAGQVIPRTLAQNCGTNVIRVLTKLRAKHSEPNSSTYGIDGNTGEITDMQVRTLPSPVHALCSAMGLAAKERACLRLCRSWVSGSHTR
eukprot:scaffold4501_cov395-Prasinococcus_capsulatus_cf.AAC.3